MRIQTLFTLLVLSLFVAGPVRAQVTPTFTANSTTYSPAGGQVVFSLAIDYTPISSTLKQLGFKIVMPSGWAHVSTQALDLSLPQVRPAAGTSGALEYGYTSWPATSIACTITVSYPAGLAGNQVFAPMVFYKDGNTLAVTLTLPVVTLTSSSAVPTTPTITTQPANTSVAVGQTATLSVVATGSPTPSYQWRKAGAALLGRTDASLVLTSVTTADAGSYDVVIANSAGSVTSTAATIAVTSSGGGTNTAPTIVTQPAAVIANQGQAATFTVAATGSPAPSYQWRKAGSPIGGATTVTLSLASVATTDAGTYDVVVSNVVTSVTSNAVTLTVNATGVATPVITVQPASQAVAAGTPVTLSVAATSATPLSYQWRRDGTAVSGATGASLALSGVSAISGSYSVVVTNASGSVTSTSAVVQFGSTGPGDPTSVKPVITQQPAGRALTIGASATFAVSAFGPGTLTYQWFKDGTAISGATTVQWAIPSVTAASAGGYRVDVTNAAGTTASATAPLTVSDRSAPPTITAQPSPQSVLAGGTAVFTVAASGNPAPAYRWRKNGVDLSSATTSTLTLANVQSADAAGYDVVVSSAAGTTVSSLAQLTVPTAAVAPVIVRQPASVTLAAGRPASLRVVATGAPAPTYQWRKDGTVLTGATSAALTFAALAAGDAGNYSVTLTNTAGSVTSLNAAVAVPARSYAGTWFGTFGGILPTQTGLVGVKVAAAETPAGTFALQIGEDNRGTFLGFAPGSRTAFVTRTATVDETGRFRFSVTVPGATPGAPDVVLAGSIADDGTLSGTTTGTTAVSSLAANKSPETAVGIAAAGVYAAGAAGGSAQIFSVVSPDGRALVLAQKGTTVDAVTGSLDANGRLTATSAAQQTVTATFAAETVSASVTDTKGVATAFSGFSAGAAALAEQRLINISTRTTAGTGDAVTIVGFVVDGLESKTVLIRAVGPTLASFGVTGVLAAPRLELHRGTDLLGTNTGWGTAGNAAAIAAAAARSGAFVLAATSADSAMLVTLAPGAYTAVVSAADGRPGIGLVEIYDLSGASLDQKLINISTRASAGADEATLIVGLVVGGKAPKRVLVRAVGPTLAQFGVSGVLARPQLTLAPSGGTTLAQNAGWTTSDDAAAIAEAAARVGAFAFSAGSLDAALLVNLAPGAYTAQVSGLGGTTGTVLVEAYEVP